MEPSSTNLLMTIKSSQQQNKFVAVMHYTIAGRAGKYSIPPNAQVILYQSCKKVFSRLILPASMRTAAVN